LYIVVVTGYHLLNGDLYKLELINNPTFSRLQDSDETVLYVMCCCESLAELGCRQYGADLLNPGISDYHKVRNSKQATAHCSRRRVTDGVILDVGRGYDWSLCEGGFVALHLLLYSNTAAYAENLYSH
jgi:hypothetical protein